MANAHKTTRIKTGPHSWINITQHRNGGNTTSITNTIAGKTTNISSKGVRRTENNKGWVTRTHIPARPKSTPRSKTKGLKPIKIKGFSLSSLLFGSSKKKSSRKPHLTASSTEHRKIESNHIESERIQREHDEEIKRLREKERLEKKEFLENFVGPPRRVPFYMRVISWTALLLAIYVILRTAYMFIEWMIYNI